MRNLLSFFVLPFLVSTILLALFISPTPVNAAETYPPAITLSGRVFNTSSTNLSWNRNSQYDFKEYFLMRSTQNMLPTYPQDEPAWSTNDRSIVTFSDTLNSQGETYYRVCSLNTSNNSTCSNVIMVSPDGSVKSLPYYTDIARDSWYETFVQILFGKGIISADSNLKFQPSHLVTRGELAEMVVKAYVDKPSSLDSVQAFCDVEATNPQAKYISYLKISKVVEGVPVTTCAIGADFKPNKPVNRAEALKIILLAFEISKDPNYVEPGTYPYQNSDLYLDVHQSDWFAGWVMKAKDLGIITGYPDDTFGPGNVINKAEMVKIIYGALKTYKSI